MDTLEGMVHKPNPSPGNMETAPWALFHQGEQEILIDVDGGISVDGGVSTNPFPCEITFASICDKGLIATWVDHELQLARMALLSLSEPLKQGVSRSDLRLKRNTMVEGSLWCHIVDAEPVAMDSDGDMIVFALWSRGLYCIDSSSNEIWRLPLIEEKNKSPPRSNEITAISIVEDEVVAWTKGGTFQRISLANGDILQTSELGVECDIKRVFVHENTFLISSTDGWVWEFKNNEITIARKLRGTIQDAVHDGSDWRIISWRDDILLCGESKTRSELGVQIVRQKDTWMVLDNQGNRSPHMG